MVSVLSLICVSVKAEYPEFSWDTVPLYFHFGKKTSELTDAEIEFVAKRSNFICLEKGHALDQFGSTEKGIAHDARRLKTANPKMKVLFYWNSFLNYPLYDACKTMREHPEWVFCDKEGKPIHKSGRFEQYNLLNPDFRRWWASIAGKGVKEYGCDGIFMDAVNQAKRPLWMNKGWGKGNEDKLTAAVIDMMKLARKEMGKEAILLYNGINTTDGLDGTKGLEYLEYADGVMVEHFTAFRSRNPRSIAADIEAIGKAAKAGKIVVVKGWPEPGFAWNNKEKMKLPAEQLAREAREKITFSLACYLVAVQKNCYFCYSWGYREQQGSLLDYPELNRPLGKPKQNARKKGWIYTRSFEHADIRVDISTRDAEIEWK